MKNKTFIVEGMTCSACSNRVERVVGKLDGVQKSTVNFATEKLTVDMDETIVGEEKIKEVVEKAGYKLIDEVDIKKEEKKICCIFNFCYSFIINKYGTYAWNAIS